MKLILQYKGFPRKRTLHLWKNTKVGDICNLLPYDREERLVLEYKRRTLSRRTTLQTAKVTSGDIIFVVTKRQKVRRVLSALSQKSKDPCMITLETKGDRALMSCGHAISPEGLFQFLNNELASGKTEIHCPYTGKTNSFTPCNKLWEINEIQEKACLLSSENLELIRKLRVNIAKFKKIRNNNILNPDAARLCLLSRCKRKKLHSNRGMQVSCPSRRACPKCGVLIDHTAGCPRMGCTVSGCNYSFCFICLKSACNSSNCSVAPLQEMYKSKYARRNKTHPGSKPYIEFGRKN